MPFISFKTGSTPTLHSDIEYPKMLNNLGSFYQSACSMKSIMDPSRVHVLYGMSKDFFAYWMRVGVLQTQDANLYEDVSSIKWQYPIASKAKTQ